jgi:hypothetical protein
MDPEAIDRSADEAVRKMSDAELETCQYDYVPHKCDHSQTRVPGQRLGGPGGSGSVYSPPDDIVVTSVEASDDDPDLTVEPGDDFAVAAQGHIQWNGSKKTVILSIGTAELVLTYDTEDQESATHAAILMASAPQALAEIDAMEESDPDAPAAPKGPALFRGYEEMPL